MIYYFYIAKMYQINLEKRNRGRAIKGTWWKIRRANARTPNRSILKLPVTKLFRSFGISSNGQECCCEYEREWWRECEQECTNAPTAGEIRGRFPND